MDYFIRQFIASIGIFFRTIKAFFSRRIMGLAARFKQLTNFSRHATKVANASFQGAAAAVKKPTKREDYIETQRLFIAKSFLVFLLIGIILVGVFCYFVAWPFILSHFLTAKFYVRDSRVEDWTGKVIVYSDKSKKTPMYSGKLEDGRLEGPGKEYDEDGLLTFEGDFVAGVKEGSGKSYEAGVLIYEGGFAQGKYQGSGTLYEDGLPLYEGQFNEGVYEGSGKLYSKGVIAYEGEFHEGVSEGAGTLYEDGKLSYKGNLAGGVPEGSGTLYEDGTKVYEGGFAGGEYSGEGTLFYPDGSVSYKGGFAGGVYDGEGTEYREDGTVSYSGGYAGGKTEGPGTVTLENGDKVEANFTGGVTDGMIEWSKNGRVWYDGGADDLTPDGFGTIYADSGKVIYQGSMDEGCIDGTWLLTLTADELREVFGEASVTESERDGGGFLMTNKDLGLTVLCTYRSDDGEPSAHRLWFFPEEGSASADLLPWGTREEAEDWAAIDRDGFIDLIRTSGSMFIPGGGADGEWVQSVGHFDSYNMSLVSADEDSAPIGIVWALVGGKDVPVIDSVDESVSDAQEALEGLLETLDKVTAAREPSGEDSGDTPGGGQDDDDQGGDTPGGGTTGGETPGGDTPGGGTTGGETPGGDTPGGGTTGGDTPGGDTPGGGTTGGDTPGGGTPGDAPGGTPGSGDVPGGGDNPGGGEDPGAGSTPGGEDSPGGGDEPGSGDSPSSGDEPGSGDSPGSGDEPGGEDSPGSGDEPGGEDSPGSGDEPGGEDSPSSGDEPGGEDSPGSGNEPSGGVAHGSPAANVEELLESVKDMTQATKLMGALINSCAYDNAVTALKAARPLKVKSLDEQKALRDKGLGSDEAVQELQDSLNTMDHQLYQYNVMLQQARITVETLTDRSVEGLDLSDVLLAVNVSSVDVDLLYADALQYAKDLAADRYEVDPAEVLVDVKVKLLDLTIAYDNIEQGKSALARSQEVLARVTESYSRGEAEKADLYSAQCAVNDAVASLFQTIASYTNTFNSLNDLSGGWMARQFNWFPEPFAPLKAASIATAREEADKAAEKAAEMAKQKEEEEKKKEEEENKEEEGKNGESSGENPQRAGAAVKIFRG